MLIGSKEKKLEQLSNNGKQHTTPRYGTRALPSFQ
jgi:hypothetical protein